MTIPPSCRPTAPPEVDGLPPALPVLARRAADRARVGRHHRRALDALDPAVTPGGAHRHVRRGRRWIHRQPRREHLLAPARALIEASPPRALRLGEEVEYPDLQIERVVHRGESRILSEALRAPRRDAEPDGARAAHLQAPLARAQLGLV